MNGQSGSARTLVAVDVRAVLVGLGLWPSGEYLAQYPTWDAEKRKSEARRVLEETLDELGEEELLALNFVAVPMIEDLEIVDLEMEGGEKGEDL